MPAPPTGRAGGPLAVPDPILDALKGKAVGGYTPGRGRPAYRDDLTREPLGFHARVRVLARPFTVAGRAWSDRPTAPRQQARVVAVTAPATLPVEDLRTDAECEHPRRRDPIPLPAGDTRVVAVDATLRRGSVRMVELAGVEPVGDR